MKHVLITGGSEGLGKVTAKKLKEAGFTVTILADNKDSTEAAARELDCHFVVADVSVAQAVKAAIDQAEKTAPIDILINNAGIWIQGELETNDPSRIKRVLEINTLGPIYCTQAVIAVMKKRRSGRIINISSQGGLYAKAERSAYATSKWGLTGFTKAMQIELKPYGIAVDGFYPGAMATAIFAKAKNERDMSKAMDPAVVADAIVYACQLPDGIRINEFGIESLRY